MASEETDLEMACRHVREGTRHVERQREIVAELHEHGVDTSFARELLAEFEATLRDHRAHVARLLSAVAPADSPRG